MNKLHTNRLYRIKASFLCIALSFAGNVFSVQNQSTYVFNCEDHTDYTVRIRNDVAWVFMPNETLNLPSVPSDNGAAFSNDKLTVIINEDSAEFIQPGQIPMHCFNNRKKAIWEKAKLDGADFRATGNEPGWHLTIEQGERIVLVSDYGASQLIVPLPQVIENPQAGVSRWTTPEMELEISAIPCVDSMSDEKFESTVTVKLKDKTLNGCGRALH